MRLPRDTSTHTAYAGQAAWSGWAGREVVAAYVGAAPDGRLHLRLELAHVVLLHFRGLLVQRVLRVGVLQKRAQP